MKKIAIVGAGGLGREVYCIIQSINKIEQTWEFIGFFDDGKPIGSCTEYGEILGGVEAINDVKKPLDLVVAIANGSVVEKIVNKIRNAKVNFPNIIAPDTKFYDKESITMGIGNIIGIGSIISCNFQIGNFNSFSCGIVVGHDLKIGNYNAITNCCAISGNVTIGDRTFFGASSVVLPLRKIASDVIVGAGGIVVKDIVSRGTYVGNPVKKIK